MISKNHLFSSKNLFFALAAGVFIILAFRAYYVPFNHDEVATFFNYVQINAYHPYDSVPDANNHILNSFLTDISFHFFGSDEWALRLPSLLSFFILVWAIHRLMQFLESDVAKIILVGSFLLCFPLLAFYGMCRGYGMSMSFYLLAFSFVLDYFKNQKPLAFIFFILSFQLGISANLTLMIPALLVTVLVILFQLMNRKAFHWMIIPFYFLHFFLIYFWANYSLYLKEKGALYYGEGDNYWEITFKTLIELLYDTTNVYLITLIGILFSVFTIYAIYKNLRLEIRENLKYMQPFLFFTILFPGLIVSFFILHVWKEVNYPEDRTGLFFYPPAVLMIVFLFDNFRFPGNKAMAFASALLFLLPFSFSLNFSSQTVPEYETIPARFYSRLVDEQNKSDQRLIIGGYRLTEFMFAYHNYKNGYLLNPLDHGESINLYCDYGIATRLEKDEIKEHYEILDESEWGYLLIKRKKFCKRELVQEIKSFEWKELQNEFNEYLRISDSLLKDDSPILVEMDFDIDHTAQPFNGWLVLEILDKEAKKNYYKRMPLRWMGENLNQSKNNKVAFFTDKMPFNLQSMVIYLWNQKKEFIKIKMNSVKIYKLKLQD